MAKFSTCLIVKNEEKTLPRLIESLKGIEDIVLVDTGSSDKTIEIAKSLGVRVFEKKFNIVIDEELKKKIDELVGEGEVKIGDTAFNFSEARNFAASKAKHDIVFMPDADEVVEWDLEAVEKLLDKGVDRLEYNFIFSFDNEGRPLIQFLHSKFYNRKKYGWVRNIHEVIVPKTYTNQIEGWMTGEELNFLHELAKQYSTIAEIGSWKGRSTHALLSGCKGKVTAIDHFKGSGEGDKTHGTETYDEFIENVGHFKNLIVKKMTSEEASKEDKKYDMVFIDAGHTYEEVKKDIELWENKATKILCGHDYCDAWLGVKKAVEEKLGKVGVVGSIWYKILEGDVPDVSYKNIFTDKILLKHYQNRETNRGQYLKGLAIDYIQNGYNDRNAHYFGRELYYKGKWEKAIKIFELHIKNNGWKTEQGQSLIYMGHCYLYLGQRDKAMECYAKAFTYDMGRREPILAMADLLYREKRWTEASRLYQLSLTIPKGNYYSNSAPNYGHYPWGQLSVCLYYEGKKKESYDCLKKAVELDPNNKTYKENLKYYTEFLKEKPKIPKVLHFLWVGDKPVPMQWINTWREKHPDWEYILWDNEKVFGRKWINQKLIDAYKEKKVWHGVADVCRYEILCEYGGLHPGTDSVCLKNTDELWQDGFDGYAVYENEKVRPGLVSPLYVSVKNGVFVKLLIEGLKDVLPNEPWHTTGNAYMKRMIEKHKPNIKIFPSYYFSPVHYTGETYKGDGPIYAKQLWGTTKNLY